MAILYIFVIPSDPIAIKLLFKLIPMWLILLYAYLQLPTEKLRYQWFILVGLFFCMLGDGLLHYFVVGLSAFLVGHLFYTASFLRRWRFSRARIAFLLPLVLYGAFMAQKLVRALVEDDNNGLIIPVLLYLVVILSMAFSAMMTGNRRIIAGSLLFVVSDSILSWNMFVSDVAHSGVLIMSTYYAAQTLLACSLRESRGE